MNKLRARAPHLETCSGKSLKPALAWPTKGSLYSNSVTPISFSGERPVVQDRIGLNGGEFPIGVALNDDGKELLVANATCGCRKLVLGC
jgi:hypothetical protein